jgi:hypothetical protein
MEVEIKSKRVTASFLVDSLAAVMDHPRTPTLIYQLEELARGPLMDPPVVPAASLEEIIAHPHRHGPFASSGHAMVVLQLNTNSLIVHPDPTSYVHFPLFRVLPQWQEYLN